MSNIEIEKKLLERIKCLAMLCSSNGGGGGITDDQYNELIDKISDLERSIGNSTAFIPYPITPTSEASEVEKGFWVVVNEGVYTNFGGVEVPAGSFGIIYKNGEEFTIELIRLPTAVIDTELDVESNNSIANSAVAKHIIDTGNILKQFYKNNEEESEFVKRLEAKDAPVKNDGNNGRILYKNNTYDAIAGYPQNWVIHNYDVTNYTQLKYKVHQRINANNRTTLLGIKNDNTIVEIVRGLNASDNVNYVEGTLDITDYKAISWEVLETHTGAYLDFYVTSRSTIDLYNYLDPNLPREFLGGDNSNISYYNTSEILINSSYNFLLNKITNRDNTLFDVNGFVSFFNFDISNKKISKVKVRLKRTRPNALTEMRTALIAIDKYGRITELIPYVRGVDENLVEELVVNVPLGTYYLSGSTQTNVTGGGYLVEAVEKYVGEYNDIIIGWRNWVRGGANNVTTAKSIELNMPKILRLDLTGQLPSDKTSARQSKDFIVEFSTNGVNILTCNAKLSIQGRSSAEHPKKGYTLDLFNKEWEDFEIKFPGWYSKNSWHLKAFWGDELLTRDVSAGRLYEQMYKSLPYPYSYNSPIELDSTSQDSKYLYRDVAKFYTDGIPCETYLGGNFIGLHILRMKKDIQNYRLLRSNRNHIHLESYDGGTFIHTWDATKWELRNPKIEGYVAGGAINDTGINTAMNRFTKWVADCAAGTVDFNTTFNDYIEINNWIDYLIHAEVLYSVDGLINNYQLVTYDGLKFYIYPYDLDYILGYRLATPPNINYTGRLIEVFDNKLLKLINQYQFNAIKDRYKVLRDKKILETGNFIEIFSDIPKTFGEKLLKANFEKWGSFQYENFTGHRSSIQYLATAFQNRLNYLDTVFTYS